ncbi:MAG: hypothetical protein QM784_29480 [Polyangiaceae bacterium]
MRQRGLADVELARYHVGDEARAVFLEQVNLLVGCLAIRVELANCGDQGRFNQHSSPFSGTRPGHRAAVTAGDR